MFRLFCALAMSLLILMTSAVVCPERAHAQSPEGVILEYDDSGATVAFEVPADYIADTLEVVADLLSASHVPAVAREEPEEAGEAADRPRRRKRSRRRGQRSKSNKSRLNRLRMGGSGITR